MTPTLLDAEETSARNWPVLGAEAMQGRAGDIVRLLEPHTEADPAALLVQLLAHFGCLLKEPHVRAGNAKHPARIWPLVVGKTSGGAKGTSLAAITAIMRATAITFDANVVGGLSSGEGLIELVADAVGEPDSKDFRDEVIDKRLLVLESEYNSVLVRSRREGNTLGPILRQAWDGGTLSTLNRKQSSLRATDPHISVVGHITPREFRNSLRDAEMAGGSINRLLICLSKRSKLLPDGGNIPLDVLGRCAAIVEDSFAAAAGVQEVMRSESARELWISKYPSLTKELPDGWRADATSRAVPYVLRLSLAYALIDGHKEIGEQHLRAALALWSYSSASSTWLFADANESDREAGQDDLLAFIVEGGKEGRTRTEVVVGFFRNNSAKSVIDERLRPLIESGAIAQLKRDTGAPRKTTVYCADEFTNLRNMQVECGSELSNVVGHEIRKMPPTSKVSEFVNSQPPNSGEGRRCPDCGTAIKAALAKCVGCAISARSSA